MKYVDVFYKCSCQKAERHVFLEERRPAEDVEVFMRRMVESIGIDHLGTSPLCMAAEMEYAKFEVAPDGSIGKAPGGTA